MKTNLQKEEALTENAAGIGWVTREMMREGAVELAVSNGRSAQDVWKSDWEQASERLVQQGIARGEQQRYAHHWGINE
jgi:hypothetical protein